MITQVKIIRSNPKLILGQVTQISKLIQLFTV